MGISISIFIEIQKVQTVKYMIGARKITVNVNTGFTVRAPSTH